MIQKAVDFSKSHLNFVLEPVSSTFMDHGALKTCK